MCHMEQQIHVVFLGRKCGVTSNFGGKNESRTGGNMKKIKVGNIPVFDRFYRVLSRKDISLSGGFRSIMSDDTVARRRIDHKGFTSFHRDRPPILIVSGKLGSTTLFGHARVQKPSMRVGCAVCVLQLLTAEHGPAPVTTLLHARMFTVYCAGICCRDGAPSTLHHLHHATSHNGVTTLRQCVCQSSGVG